MVERRMAKLEKAVEEDRRQSTAVSVEMLHPDQMDTRTATRSRDSSQDRYPQERYQDLEVGQQAELHHLRVLNEREKSRPRERIP